jgi:hypothetical protein
LNSILRCCLMNKTALSAREGSMVKLWSKCAGFRWLALAVVIVPISFSWPAVAADGGADGGALEDRVGAVFYRSMTHWKYDYAKLPDRKAGVACIPWERLDTAFLDSAIFEAFGFSYSVAEEEVAIRIATQGCNKMKAYYKVTDCTCELVLIDEAVAVDVPEEAGEQ